MRGDVSALLQQTHRKIYLAFKGGQVIISGLANLQRCEHFAGPGQTTLQAHTAEDLKQPIWEQHKVGTSASRIAAGSLGVVKAICHLVDCLVCCAW